MDRVETGDDAANFIIQHNDLQVYLTLKCAGFWIKHLFLTNCDIHL